MATKAQQLVMPTRTDVFRVIFLYVGQGDATLLVIPDGTSQRIVLLDNNIDRRAGGIDTKALLKDLGRKVDVFINTHPHQDHTEGLDAIHEAVGVGEVWHSGHVPSRDRDDAYQEMMGVIKKISTANEYKLRGTDSLNKIRKADGETEVIKQLGQVDYQVLSPAAYVCDDIEGEEGSAHDRRIHEQCAVLRFSYGNPARHVLLTGDADRDAWELHIMNHHEAAAKADVLSAVHHGSRSFFMECKDDEDVYEKHLEAIAPDYIVVSAPKQSESDHDHPHDDAMKLYRKHVDAANLLHLGKNRESVIVDIYPNGQLDVKIDQDLATTYGYDATNKPSGGGGKGAAAGVGILGGTRLDHKPMGAQ
jgi:beta-lactamase superfamily II metal-dependent hydrolase